MSSSSYDANIRGYLVRPDGLELLLSYEEMDAGNCFTDVYLDAVSRLTPNLPTAESRTIDSAHPLFSGGDLGNLEAVIDNGLLTVAFPGAIDGDMTFINGKQPLSDFVYLSRDADALIIQRDTTCLGVICTSIVDLPNATRFATYAIDVGATI